MQVKDHSTFVLCAALALVLALPATAAQPSDNAPALAPTEAPVVLTPSVLQLREGCAGQISGNLFDPVAAPMTPAARPVLQTDLPDPGAEEYCWIESRWVYNNSCCTKSWGLAAVLRLQNRTCCQVSGCGSWGNTGTTQCSGYPCP